MIDQPGQSAQLSVCLNLIAAVFTAMEVGGQAIDN